MSAAAAAVDFRARHPERRVLGFANGIVERLPEARPASAALVFGVRGEQRQIATGAGKDALAFFFQERARTWPLGAVLAQDFILLRRELCAPFGVGLFHLEFLGGLRRRGAQPAESGEAKQAGQGCEQDTAVDHGNFLPGPAVPGAPKNAPPGPPASGTLPPILPVSP